MEKTPEALNEMILGKFINIDELKKAYKELERAFGNKCVELKRLKNKLNSKEKYETSMDSCISENDQSIKANSDESVDQSIKANSDESVDQSMEANCGQITEANCGESIKLSTIQPDCGQEENRTEVNVLPSPQESAEAVEESIHGNKSSASTLKANALDADNLEAVNELKAVSEMDTQGAGEKNCADCTALKPDTDNCSKSEVQTEASREGDFFLQFPLAEGFKHELRSADGDLTIGYIRALEARLNTEKERADYLGSDEYKEAVLSEYFKLMEQTKPPVLISKGKGAITLSPVKQPRNLFEAGELARELLRK